MKKNKAQEKKNSKNQKNLTEGIQTLIDEKAEKVEKSNQLIEGKAEGDDAPKGKKKDKAQKTEGKKDKKKSKEEKLIKKAKKSAEANLIEEVVTKREVKYIYPADCEDTLSRKKFRQQVRNKLHQLELAMLRIDDQNSKEFKKAKKEYEAYKQEYVKEAVAI